MTISQGIENSGISGVAANSPSTPTSIRAEIRAAASATGVDFSYLMQKANMESSFRPELESSSSSATGLYQFIEQTWLEMVKNHGAEHGYGEYSEKIIRSDNGKLEVQDPALRQEILDLRKDPRAASRMAAEFAAQNKEILENRLGREPNEVEMYMAHFMGANGAANFLAEKHNDPLGIAATEFPSAASANQNVFFNSAGAGKTYQEIYDSFATRMENASFPSFDNQIAMVQPAPPIGQIVENHSVMPSSRNYVQPLSPSSNGIILPLPVILALADLSLPLEQNGKDAL